MTDQLPSNLGDKDAPQNLLGMWGVEIGELASKKRTDLDIVKGFMAQVTDLRDAANALQDALMSAALEP